MKKRVFSGIQPTGLVHLGNYVGALKNWAAMQENYDCLYCLVDLHAITVPQQPAVLRENIRKTAAIVLAVGIDPKASLLFVQSDVAEHSELAWILNCFVYFGELSRMTQFKDKARVRGEGSSVGLFDYPVLMAADILLYGTHAVPVGDDQKQHMELVRMIARRVNGDHPDLFVVPEPFIGKQGARVMGLDDPTAKMSKTASSEYNYISFWDAPEVIRKKIMKAVTDSGQTIEFNEKERPAISNLLTIYASLSEETPEAVAARFAGKGYGDFKKDLAEVVIAALAPFQRKAADYLNDAAALDSILSQGAEKARALAQPRMASIRQRLGLGR